MSDLLQEIEQKAMQLTAEEREVLAERLPAGTEAVPLTEIDDAWFQEAERRYAAWKEGKTQAIPAEQVIRDLRKELRR